VSRQPRITTQRLTLRAFAPSDADDVRRLAGDFAIADTTAAIPHPYEEGMFEQWFADHAEQFRRMQAVNWAITLTEEGGGLVGAISLMNIDLQARHAEVGYWIAHDHWGLGLGTEAAEAVLEFAFTTLALNRVYACHMVRNPASGAVLRKIGMQHEGCQRQHLERWGKLEDIHLYGILAEEWASRRES
jgi:RimJ/RimL family protein N-acetyltransferase